MCFVLTGTHVCAEDGKAVPAFTQLEAVAGAQVTAKAFKDLLRDFDFSENPKRERSWGSGFGVFLEQAKNGIVSIGIRPPSRMTNMPTYGGNLPKGLLREDSLQTIRRKLGIPIRTVESEDGHVVVYYDGFHVIVLGGRLFEIWLTEFKPKAEPADVTDRRSRFGS